MIRQFIVISLFLLVALLYQGCGEFAQKQAVGEISNIEKLDSSVFEIEAASYENSAKKAVISRRFLLNFSRPQGRKTPLLTQNLTPNKNLPESPEYRSFKLGNRFEFDITPSGAIYRLNIPGLGDVIGDQIPDGQWIDRVFQSVAVDTRLNSKANKWFLHQAGVYGRHGRRDQHYSPRLQEVWNANSNEHQMVIMPQMAHDPTPSNARQNVLLIQNLRAVSPYALEITYTWVNHSKQNLRLNHFNLPWTGLSSQKFDSIYGGASSSQLLYKMQQTPHFGDGVSIGPESNGRISFHPQQVNGRFGLGILWGQGGKVRIGTHAPEDLVVVSRIANPTLAPGQAMSATYYLLFSDLANMSTHQRMFQKYAKIRHLNQNRVRYLRRVCLGAGRGANRYADCAGQSPNFLSINNWSSQLEPLYLLKEASTPGQQDSFILTNRPHQFLGRYPLESQRQLWSFIGWAKKGGLSPLPSPHKYCRLKNMSLPQNVRLDLHSSSLFVASPGSSCR